MKECKNESRKIRKTQSKCSQILTWIQLRCDFCRVLLNRCCTMFDTLEKKADAIVSRREAWNETDRIWTAGAGIIVKVLPSDSSTSKNHVTASGAAHQWIISSRSPTCWCPAVCFTHKARNVKRLAMNVTCTVSVCGVCWATAFMQCKWKDIDGCDF